MSATVGATDLNLELEWGEATQHVQPYHVLVSPQLPAGQQLGYVRRIKTANYLPLTRQALQERASEPGFPSAFVHDGRPFYGIDFDVVAEVGSLRLKLEFPPDVSIRSHRAVAIIEPLDELNVAECIRINAEPRLQCTTDPETGDTVLQLEVASPIYGHRYVLLYEPDE